MDLWIRSQGKSILIKVNSVILDEKQKNIQKQLILKNLKHIGNAYVVE